MSEARAVVRERTAGAVRFGLEAGGAPLSWAQVARGLKEGREVGAALSEALVGAGFEALFFEARPVRADDADLAFEGVAIDAPELAGLRADGAPFAGKIAGERAPAVCVFPNLGGDARLVVPAPGADPQAYAHLAAFLRGAGPEQAAALWRAVGEETLAWLAQREDRLWVGTDGRGVWWLHVRLDSTPKYTKWQEYRVFQAGA